MVFDFLIQRTIDLLCLTILAIALVVPWRWPFALQAAMCRETKNQKAWLNRESCFTQCGISFAELFTYACFLPVCLCSGLRTVQLIRMLTEAKGSKWDEKELYNSGRQEAIALCFMDLLADVLNLAFQALTLLVLCATLMVGVWRWAWLCSKLRDPSVRKDWKVFNHARGAARHALFYYNSEACDVAWEYFIETLVDLPFLLMGAVVCVTWRMPLLYLKLRRLSEAGESNAKSRRKYAAAQFGQLGVDLVCVPFFLIVVCSWRSRSLLRAIATAGKGFEKQRAILREFTELLLDVPFLLIGVVVLLSGWRANLLVRDLRAATGATGRREAAWKRLCQLLRDGPAFFLFALLTLTLYRLPAVVLKLVAATKRMLCSPAQLTVTEASIALDAKAKLRLVVCGRLALPPPPGTWRVALRVGGHAFWQSVSSVLGSTAASVAQAMLPLALVPQRGAVTVDEADNALRLDVTLSAAPPSTVLKKLRALEEAGDHPFTLQAEYGRRTGVLFELRTKPSVVRRALIGSTTYTTPATVQENAALVPLPLDIPTDDAHTASDGATRTPFQDLFWSAAVFEGVQLLLDVPHLLLACLIVLAPWRWGMMLRTRPRCSVPAPARHPLPHGTRSRTAPAHARGPTQAISPSPSSAGHCGRPSPTTRISRTSSAMPTPSWTRSRRRSRCTCAATSAPSLSRRVATCTHGSRSGSPHSITKTSSGT